MLGVVATVDPVKTRIDSDIPLADHSQLPAPAQGELFKMHESIMEQLWQTSHLQGGNLAYVEQLFETYLTDPNAVPEEWRSYFDKPVSYTHLTLPTTPYV